MKKFFYLFCFLSALLFAVSCSSTKSDTSGGLSGISATEGRTAVVSDIGSLKLRWDMPGEVFEITHETPESSSVTSVNGNEAEFSGLADDSAHTFIIRSGGEHAVAYGYVGSLNNQPAKISAVADKGSAEISWQAISGVLSYELYISTAENGEYSKVGEFQSTSATVSGLTNGTTYYFKAVAVYSKTFLKKVMAKAEASVFSVLPGYTFGEVTAVTPGDGLDKHPRVFKGYLKNNYVHFMWDAVVKATGYKVYKSASSDGEYTLAASVTDNAYNQVLPVSYKYYKVRATFADGEEGEFSQYIYIMDRYTLDWTLKGGIEVVTVTLGNYSVFDNITLSCMGVGESQWVSTLVTKSPFTAGYLDAGDYDCKLTANSGDTQIQSDVKRTTVFRKPNPDEKLSVYVWDNNAALRWDGFGSEIYSVLLSTDGGSTISVANDNITNLSYTFSNLECGKNYTAYISSQVSGASVTSSPVEFTLDTLYCASITPPAPSGKNLLTKLTPTGNITPRYHRSVTIGNKIYLFGASYNNNMYMYEIDSNAWTLLAPAGLLPQGRSDLAMEAINGKIYIFGGNSGNSGGNLEFNDTWVFDPNMGSNGTWSELKLTVTPPQARCATSVIYKNKMYVFLGGSADTWVFDPNSGEQGTWTKLAKGARISLFNQSVAVINDAIYFFGGDTTANGVANNDLLKYFPDNDTVIKLNPSHPLLGRKHSAVAVHNNKMYIYGGLNSVGTSGDLWVFDPSDGSQGIWEKIIPEGGIPTTEFYGTSASLWNNQIYLIGSLGLYRYEP